MGDGLLRSFLFPHSYPIPAYSSLYRQVTSLGQCGATTMSVPSSLIPAENLTICFAEPPP